MNQTLRRPILAVFAGALFACTPSTNVPGTDLYIDAPDGKHHGDMSALTIRSETTTLEVSDLLMFSAIGVFEDGVEVDVSDHVYWRSENEDVLLIGAREGRSVPVQAMKTGDGTITVLLGDLNAQLAVTVVPASLTQIELSGVENLIGRGESVQLTATGIYKDGTRADLTGEVVWSSSAPSVARVNDAGRLTAVQVGAADITAQVGEIIASVSLIVECRYPTGAPNTVLSFDVMPNISWNGAYQADGSQLDFALEDVHCSADYENVDAIIFVVVAGWCAPCKVYMRDRLRPMGQQIVDAGGLVVFVEGQDANYGTADNEEAFAYIAQWAGDMPGIRVGDFNARPMANVFLESPVLTAFPTTLVVRKSDMKIIADQGTSNYYLPLLDILANPEWDWSDPQNPVQSFRSNCAEGQDEASEPNDRPEQASTTGAAVIDGGICTAEPDYFQVEIEGRWRATLLFTHRTGDLDMFVWDTATGAPVRRNGTAVASTSTNDGESLEFDGPGLLRIHGKSAGSAPYQLFIEPL